jgi:DNA-binding transcriptional ArsR family regulator
MNTNEIARIAALIGEPARTAMLLELMDDRALTPQTASKHLSLLVEGGLLTVVQSGRHRYHRLNSPDVAKLLEGIMQLSTRPHSLAQRKHITGPKEADMRRARTCYDHIAGRLGVAIADTLLEQGAVSFDGDSAQVNGQANVALAGLGMTLDAALPSTSTRTKGKPIYCRPCLDWSERRHHLAGRLGSLICSHCLSQGWLRRQAKSRALDITPEGVQHLRNWLGTERWSQVA